MTYDGYGRLKTKHVPEQNVGANTTWDYKADDTIEKVTDGRGAAATYAYNNRHLMELASPTQFHQARTFLCRSRLPIAMMRRLIARR